MYCSRNGILLLSFFIFPQDVMIFWTCDASSFSPNDSNAEGRGEM
jgi:hypothetical protein